MRSILGFDGMVRVLSRAKPGKDFAETFKVSIAGPGAPDAPGVTPLDGLVAELTWHNLSLETPPKTGADIIINGVMAVVSADNKYQIVIYADYIIR